MTGNYILFNIQRISLIFSTVTVANEARVWYTCTIAIGCVTGGFIGARWQTEHGVKRRHQSAALALPISGTGRISVTWRAMDECVLMKMTRTLLNISEDDPKISENRKSPKVLRRFSYVIGRSANISDSLPRILLRPGDVCLTS